MQVEVGIESIDTLKRPPTASGTKCGRKCNELSFSLSLFILYREKLLSIEHEDHVRGKDVQYVNVCGSYTNGTMHAYSSYQ